MFLMEHFNPYLKKEMYQQMVSDLLCRSYEKNVRNAYLDVWSQSEQSFGIS